MIFLTWLPQHLLLSFPRRHEMLPVNRKRGGCDVQIKTMEAQKDLGDLVTKHASEMELPSVGSLFEGQKDAWLSLEISFRHS